ncbi:tetratricopeptide repeat protein 1 isoform X1 [Pieris brassicae]|uniref:tetratricopeptide repeat protein 1 isoform X1 n=1 Tax=Pieris brassicae TaxID=7116 RepID=UPI001E660061|nr:tetratricopeptide repeat protein 1 isoform X1 [Pieris brassicae]
MSERLKSDLSNEEVIEDLTKNLDFSLRPNDVDDNNIINPEIKNDDHNAKGDRNETNEADFTDIPLDEPENSKNIQSEDEDSDTDVDELSLKDAEMDLTDDQKEERRVIAEELKVVGNDAYKVGDYDRSIEKYTEGLRICPLKFPETRGILYCNRSAAKMKMENHKKAIKDCTKAIELKENYLKAYLRRAISYEATDKFDESLEDYKKVLELEPSNANAKSALVRLPPKIEKRNEELKTEVMGKLKDLGNMILRPFGLSTENFKLEQDPESKGYKINFKQ